MIPVKPGLKTTELWVVVVAALLIATGLVPEEHATELAVLAVGYAGSRGIAKVSPTADWAEDPHKATPDDEDSADVSPEERPGV